MDQQSLINVHVQYEIDSTDRFDGADLKRIAHGDDGRDYAAKRVADGPLIPISEWVGYHLWRACGLLTPDFAILHYSEDEPPAFGSRIELVANQIEREPNRYTIAGFFGQHLHTVSLCYPLDAFFVNPDRHGRNFLERPTLTQPALLCLDYSRAWATQAQPCGNPRAMQAGNSIAWWRFFVGHMKVVANFEALQAAVDLDNAWLADVLERAPAAWRQHFDVDGAIKFWHRERALRAQFARDWAALA